MGASSSKVKEGYELREGTKEVYWDRRWLRKIPTHTYQFTSITKFSLSHNFLAQLSPEIGKLQNLTELILFDNILGKHAFPPEFATLTKLQLLDLSENDFSAMPIEALLPLTSLHTLNLNNNRIFTIPPEFGQLTQLNSLTIKNNRLETVPEQLTQLKHLYTLDLSRNSICTFPKAIKHLHSLRMLQLSQNNITRVPSFKRLTNLVYLDISGNCLSTIHPKISYIVDTSASQHQDIEYNIGKLRVLNVRDNLDLFELPQELVKLRPPLTLYSSIPSEIIPRIYLGGLDAASNFPMLQHLKISHIILAIADMPPQFPKNFEYHILPDAKDTPSYDLSVHFDQCCNFIDRALEDGNVFIHCRAGISRSATITIAYIMRKHKMKFEQALRFVSSKRPQIEPNVGFREQLMRYEVFLFDIHKIGHNNNININNNVNNVNNSNNVNTASNSISKTPRRAASRGPSITSIPLPAVRKTPPSPITIVTPNGVGEIIFCKDETDGESSSPNSSHSDVVDFSNIGELE